MIACAKKWLLRDYKNSVWSMPKPLSFQSVSFSWIINKLTAHSYANNSWIQITRYICGNGCRLCRQIFRSASESFYLHFCNRFFVYFFFFLFVISERGTTVTNSWGTKRIVSTFLVRIMHGTQMLWLQLSIVKTHERHKKWPFSPFGFFVRDFFFFISLCILRNRLHLQRT